MDSERRHSNPAPVRSRTALKRLQTANLQFTPSPIVSADFRWLSNDDISTPSVDEHSSIDWGSSSLGMGSQGTTVSEWQPTTEEVSGCSPASSSCLDTPKSLLNSPSYWNDNLPREQLVLTYGVELEHICAINTSPGPGHEWMFKDDHSNGKSDDESFHESPVPQLTWIDCRDNVGTSAHPVTHGDWHMEAPNWTEGVVPHGGNDPREDACMVTNAEWHSEAPNWNEGDLPHADWAEEDSCGRTYGWDVEATKEVQKNVLRRKGLSCVTHAGIEYQTWELKQDISISAPTDFCMLPQDLKGKIKEASNSLSFKTFSTSPGMLEIASYLKVVKGTPSDPWGAMTNESCGFHVHVARKDELGSEMIPLPVLQHLAYFIVRYEDIVTNLHPISRRATWGKDPSGVISGPSLMLGSNLMGFRRSPHLCQRLAEIDLEAAEKKIFAENMTANRLSYLLDTAYTNWPGAKSHPARYKFVNFQRLTMKNVAKTIEFRQYEGTLDFEHISHWVHFILSMVRAAERMATNNNPVSLETPTSSASQGRAAARVAFPRQQGGKYKVRCARLDDELENMYDLLGFEEDTRIWWTNRFCEVNPDEFTFLGEDQDGKARFIVTQDQCPACRQEGYLKEVNTGEQW
ncbi:hypothetical protein PV11_04983 [Exophiala sideris]|uniref:Uncharacterized protein n=1 Tax=Exophiala sideris TaxID=1016849 RepID=A0A0D1Z811_9EURO|nr:hypothetical protein PV11_04983 [Exophiala sideris]